MKIGTLVYTPVLLWDTYPQSGSLYCDQYRIDEFRFLTSDSETIALVQENGKVLFRKSGSVFPTYQEAQQFALQHVKKTDNYSFDCDNLGAATGAMDEHRNPVECW